MTDDPFDDAKIEEYAARQRGPHVSAVSTPQTRERHAFLKSKGDTWWQGDRQQFLFRKGRCGVTTYDTRKWFLDF